MRILLVILGSVSFGLAVAGVFLPLLPTTPLLLLAAWCFFRSSPRLYEWLMRHPRFGEYIRNFREKRAVPLRVKIVATTLLWLTLGYCIAWIAKWWWLKLILAALAIAVTWHILSYATLRKEEKKRALDDGAEKNV